MAVTRGRSWDGVELRRRCVVQMLFPEQHTGRYIRLPARVLFRYCLKYGFAT